MPVLTIDGHTFELDPTQSGQGLKRDVLVAKDGIVISQCRINFGELSKVKWNAHELAKSFAPKSNGEVLDRMLELSAQATADDTERRKRASDTCEFCATLTNEEGFEERDSEGNSVGVNYETTTEVARAWIVRCVNPAWRIDTRIVGVGDAHDSKYRLKPGRVIAVSQAAKYAHPDILEAVRRTSDSEYALYKARRHFADIAHGELLKTLMEVPQLADLEDDPTLTDEEVREALAEWVERERTYTLDDDRTRVTKSIRQFLADLVPAGPTPKDPPLKRYRGREGVWCRKTKDGTYELAVTSASLVRDLRKRAPVMGCRIEWKRAHLFKALRRSGYADPCAVVYLSNELYQKRKRCIRIAPHFWEDTYLHDVSPEPVEGVSDAPD